MGAPVDQRTHQLASNEGDISKPRPKSEDMHAFIREHKSTEEIPKAPPQGKRKNAKVQNFGECLDELDRYLPTQVIAGTGFRKAGNEGIEAFRQYLEQSYGPVERPVPVVYLSCDRTVPPQVTNCVFFVMKSSEDVRRILETETHTLEDGTGIKVREFIGKER